MQTITLNSIRRRTPIKKNNLVEMTVYLDDQEYRMDFSIPLSGMVMGSQKNKKGIEEMFNQALTSKFGKVHKI